MRTFDSSSSSSTSSYAAYDPACDPLLASVQAATAKLKLAKTKVGDLRVRRRSPQK